MTEGKSVRVSGLKVANLTCPIIAIHVGEEGASVSFSVHQNIVSPRSKFFYNALKGSTWVEAEDKSVRLPEDDPATFGLYLHLLYYDTIPLPDLRFENSKSDADVDAIIDRMIGTDFVSLIKLYVLADKLDDVKSRNLIMDALVEAMNTDCPNGERYYPSTGHAALAYDGTPKSSPLRSLFVDIYLHLGEAHWLDGGIDGVEKDFLFDLAKAMLKNRAKQKDHWRLEGGDYHEKEPS